FQKDKMEKGYYEELLGKSQACIETVADQFVETNYDFAALSTEKKKQLFDLLDSIPFLPKSYREELVESADGERLYGEVENLAYVLGFIVDRFEIFAGDDQATETLLQDRLRSDVELAHVKKLSLNTLPVSEETPEIRLTKKLIELFTMKNLKS